MTQSTHIRVFLGLRACGTGCGNGSVHVGRGRGGRGRAGAADPRRLADMGGGGPYAPGPGGLDAGGGGGLAYAGGPLVAGDFASPPPLPLSEEERGRGGEEQRYAAGALDVLAGAAPQHM